MSATKFLSFSTDFYCHFIMIKNLENVLNQKLHEILWPLSPPRKDKNGNNEID